MDIGLDIHGHSEEDSKCLLGQDHVAPVPSATGTVGFGLPAVLAMFPDIVSNLTSSWNKPLPTCVTSFVLI